MKMVKYSGRQKRIYNWISKFFKENIQENVRKAFFLLFLFFIIIWLRYPINNLYDSYIVIPFLSYFLQFPIEIYSLIIFIILWIILTYYLEKYILLKLYKLDFNFLILLFFIISIYLCERFFWKSYEFLSLYSGLTITRNLSIFDPIFFSISILWISLTRNSIKWSFPTDKSTWVAEDNFLENIEEENLNRKEELKNFIKLTEELPYKLKSSYVIGVSGNWGYGKTSFIKMAKTVLNENMNNVFVEFNPWFSSGASNLTEDFFNTLDNEISKHIQTRNTILKYGKTLAKTNYPPNLLFNFKDFLTSDSPLKDRFLQISSLIEKLDKKVYILIDDLDRLDNVEVFEVLRLVRNTASFPNFIFIMAYDRSYLVNALENLKLYNPNKYLEKIIQFEIVLPRISSDVITNQLVEKINSQIDNIFEDQLLEKEAFKKQIREIILDWPEFFDNAKPKYKLRLIISEILLNMRDVIRFSNSIAFSLKNHYTKIYLPDLFIVELLKFLNPELFARLYNNNYSIYKKDNDGVGYFELYDTETDMKNIVKTPDYKISEVLDGIKLNKIVHKLVYELFERSNSEDFNSRFSIYYTENFYYYFTLFQESYQVSFKDIEALIKGLEPRSGKTITDWILTQIKQEKLESLEQKLQFDFNISCKAEFGNYLTILMALIELGNYEVANNIFLRKVINNKFNFFLKDEKKIELFTLVKEKAISPFIGISSTIRNLITSHIDNKPEEENLRNNIPTKEFLLEINLSFLRKYLSEQENSISVYETYIGLYYNCFIDIEKESNIITLSKNASKFFKQKLVENELLFEDYLKHFLRNYGISNNKFNSSVIGPEPFFEQIFGNQEFFLEELKKNNSKVSQEIQKYFKKKKMKLTVYIDDLKPTMELHLNLK